jgi:hypothetical protein
LGIGFVARGIGEKREEKGSKSWAGEGKRERERESERRERDVSDLMGIK